MTHSFQKGFTLLELLIVIGIMGLLGTVSVSGFRGLKKGMEERGAMQVVDEFVRSAYRRAVIDRVPTAVYFWNETISDEQVGTKLIAVGRAVAVRRAGWISEKDGQYLVDEFGDLSGDLDEEGDSASGDSDYRDDPGRYLYKVGDTEFKRSVVSSSAVRRDMNDTLMSDPNKLLNGGIKAYAFYLKEDGGFAWNVGDPYGFEFAELTLPKNYIFGTGGDVSKTVSAAERTVSVQVFLADGTVKGSLVTVSGLELQKSGDVAFKSIGTAADPTRER